MVLTFNQTVFFINLNTSLVTRKSAPAASAVALLGSSDRYWAYRSTLPIVPTIANQNSRMQHALHGKTHALIKNKARTWTFT